VAIRPKDVLALGPIAPFQVTFFTVTLLPLIVGVPFQTWLMVCPAGSVQLTVHPFIAVEVLLVTVTSAWNPPLQLLVTAYVAVHPVPLGGEADGAALLPVGDGLVAGPPVIR
jgi:hypothetical protein